MREAAERVAAAAPTAETRDEGFEAWLPDSFSGADEDVAREAWNEAWEAGAAKAREEASGKAQQPIPDASFQDRVGEWLVKCFGYEIAKDSTERCHRFIEEALELVQACGTTRGECLQLVDYVFNRSSGEVGQEIGGVTVTLAALCQARGVDMMACAESELKRIWLKIDKIREKQANKPKHSPLPQQPTPDAGGDAGFEAFLRTFSYRNSEVPYGIMKRAWSAALASAQSRIDALTRERNEAEAKHDAEIRHWQDAIRDHVIKLSGRRYIDGAGSDSGDPLDFTLTEISQGIIHAIDQRDEAVKAREEVAAKVAGVREQLRKAGWVAADDILAAAFPADEGRGK
jgi:hypothetical protein